MTRSDLVAEFGNRYVEVQYAYVRFLSEHLTDCSKTFGGDFAQMMILAVIGQSHLSVFMTKDADRPMQYGLTALRLADITGLPRETVRRKLALLEARQWIEKSAHGWALRHSDGDQTVARQALSDLDSRGLDRLAQLHLDIRRILEIPKTGADPT